jgi:hypothetical protein
MEKYYFKMEPREFIRKVIELYREARKPRFYHPSIKRGLSRAISGLSEDLLSYFLAVNLTEDYDIYTDQNITFHRGIKTIRPDSVIVKNNVIKHILDIKTDFGWMRDKITEFCRKKNEELINVKGTSGKVQILNHDGITKQEKVLELSDDLILHIVVISRENISKDKLDNHLQNVKNLKLEHIELYTLTSEMHPNVYEKPIEEVLKSIKIHQNEFIRLMDNLTS